MTSLPQSVRAALAADPWMSKCLWRYLQRPTPCEGRVEYEHAMYNKGAKVQEAWACVPLCSYHHRYGGLVKEYGVMFALARATNETLERHSKAEDLVRKREYLANKYRAQLLPGVIEGIKLAPLQ